MQIFYCSHEVAYLLGYDNFTHLIFRSIISFREIKPFYASCSVLVGTSPVFFDQMEMRDKELPAHSPIPGNSLNVG